ncbi:MAG TPA: IclR family transcriptional regulator [Burkholderiaceae bacterium]|nr:IclR family transcriptional regulator [Burkholderiaceae bacterium]
MLTSLGRALDVIELLARERRPLALGEIAARLGMSKSSVHEVVTTLSSRGFLERETGGIYRLGLRAWEVGNAASVSPLVRAAASPMERLAARLNEHVVLSVLSGFECVNVHMVDSAQAVRVYAAVGARYPANHASTGLALLAFQPDDYLEAVLPPRLSAATEQTINDPAELRRELARIRARGYAINMGGWRIDVLGIAAPVMSSGGVAIAGLAVAGPRYRTNRAWMRRVVPSVLAAAEEISESLSSVAPTRKEMTAS